MLSGLSTSEKELIEKYGQLMERFGISPVAARINALLTVSDRPHFTFDEIKTILNISKSATSTALNTLTLLGYVNFRTELGSRKRFFYTEIESWKLKMERDLMNLKELGEVLDEIGEIKSKKDLEQKNDVKEYSEFLLTLAEQTIIRLNK